MHYYTYTIVCVRAILHVYDRLYTYNSARIQFRTNNRIRVILHVNDCLYTCNSARIQFSANNRVRVILHVYDRLYTCNSARKRSFVYVYDRLYACTIARVRSFVCVYYCTDENPVPVSMAAYRLLPIPNKHRLNLLSQVSTVSTCETNQKEFRQQPAVGSPGPDSELHRNRA